MKKQWKIAAGLFLLLIFPIFAAACGSQEESVWEGMNLYFISADETAVVSEPYEQEASDTIGLIAEMIAALELPPASGKLKKAKPDAVKILDYSYEEGKSLILNFENNYTSLTGQTEVLCRAAIVQNFCQIEGVDLVEFYVRGQPLVLSSDLPVGLMRADDFMIAGDTLMNYKEEAMVTLYFANEAGDMLLPCAVTASYAGIISNEQLIMKLLLAGPQDAGYLKTIPDHTKINKISTKDSICYVDLSSAFMEKIQGISAEVVLYSIVNSLIENTSISQVQFLIDGSKKRTYYEIGFNGFFDRNLSLILMQ